MNEIKFINCWSPPRNISTALMYSFAQRSDTLVIDEPIFAHYIRVSKTEHPGGQEVLNTYDNDGNRVMEQILNKTLQETNGRNIVFMKQMGKHLLDIDMDFLKKTENILLIREPTRMLASYIKGMKKEDGTPIDFSISEAGYDKLISIYHYLKNNQLDAIVLDSDEVLKNPKIVLKKLCFRLGIPFEENMLSWSPGPRIEDGCWSRYWYENVHKSTGFQEYEETPLPELPLKFQQMNQQLLISYQFLLQFKIS